MLSSALSALLCLLCSLHCSAMLCYAVLCPVCSALQGSCTRRPKKIQGFSMPFHAIIQGQFKAFFQLIILQHTTLLVLEKKCIRAWRLLIISGLRQFFYPLNSNCGRKFSQSPSHQVLLKVSHRQIPNFSRPSTRFPKQFKDIFSFMKFKDFSRLALNSRPAQEPCNNDSYRLQRELNPLSAA